MTTQIRILKSELEDVHFAFERGATSNTWYHIINRRTCEQIFTMVQRGGAWCAIRGNGGFNIEYDQERYPTYASCLEKHLAKHGIEFDEQMLEQIEEQKSTIASMKQTEKTPDQFGFPSNSKANQFGKHLVACGSQGTSWTEIEEADWNLEGTSAPFYWALGKLLKDNKAVKKDGRFYLLSVMKDQPTTKSKLKPIAVPAKPAPVGGKRKPRPV